MTKKETVKILAILNAFYGQGKADPEAMVNAWHVIIHEYDYAVAEQAVFNFAKNDNREYGTFPSVGQLVQAIRDEEKMPSRIYGLARTGELYDHLPERAKEMITKERYEELQNNRSVMYDLDGFDVFSRYIKRPTGGLLEGGTQ